MTASSIMLVDVLSRRIQLRALFVASLVAALMMTSARSASTEPVIPNFWDVKERLTRPDLSNLPRLRFLTTIDFPPFNFLDVQGRLSGLHVDLAREICNQLQIVDRCQIQALPWEELEAALAQGEGEAIIAGIAVTEESRSKLAFSRSYLRFPARFVVSRKTNWPDPLYAAIAGKRIGVLAGTGHEALLRDYFPDARVVTYSRPSWLYKDLREDRLDAGFGDGMKLSFWLAGTDSAGCCRFAGGPYLAPDYLGHGLAIATGRDDLNLVNAFNYALREISASGRFEDLYLRYFPVSFY